MWFTELPFIHFLFPETEPKRRHFNSFFNKLRHNYIMHFFSSQNRTTFAVRFTVFPSASLAISLSTAVAYRSASTSRKELLSWLPSLFLVSAAESITNGWNATQRGERKLWGTVSPAYPALPTSLPTSPTPDPSFHPAKTKILKWWS